MSKDRRQQEIDRALKRAKAIKAQPTDDSYYKELLKEREFANNMYRSLLYAGRPRDPKDRQEHYREITYWRKAINHVEYKVERYEKAHGINQAAVKPNTHEDNKVNVGYDMDLPEREPVDLDKIIPEA